MAQRTLIPAFCNEIKVLSKQRKEPHKPHNLLPFMCTHKYEQIPNQNTSLYVQEDMRIHTTDASCFSPLEASQTVHGLKQSVGRLSHHQLSTAAAGFSSVTQSRQPAPAVL